jgi:hypothetical protein
MASSGMFRREAIVRTDVSEELSVCFIRVTRITDYCHPDDGDAKFLRTSVLTRTTRRNIPEDAIRHGYNPS